MATQPILDPNYWRQRLDDALALGVVHHSIFKCTLSKWQFIESRHRTILAKYIRPNHNILDVGCGYGRLLSLLPDDWKAFYMGLDISPDLLSLAKHAFPGYCFHQVDVVNQSLDLGSNIFDWAVCISMRPMLIRNLGQEAWDTVETKIKRVSRRILILEYDENDEGEVILCS